MSPSWRDRAEVSIGPYGVRIVRVRRGLRGNADPEIAVEADAAAGWPAAVEALVRALSVAAPEGADVRIVVSNHFVRYSVIPGIELLTSDEERAALARHQFQTIHGERATGWRVAVAENGARVAGIVAALDAEMLDAVLATLTAAGHVPRSVEPLLAVAFNACRGSIGRGYAWLAVAEPGRLCVGCLEDRRWIEIRNARAPQAPEAELAITLEQMRHTTGAAAGRVLFVSQDADERVPSVGPGWTVQVVPLAGKAARTVQKAA